MSLGFAHYAGKGIMPQYSANVGGMPGSYTLGPQPTSAISYNPLTDSCPNCGYTERPGLMTGYMGSIQDMLNLSYQSKQADQQTKNVALKHSATEMVFRASDFIRQPTPFINEEEEIMPYVREAHLAVTGKSISSEITITLCSPEELKKAHKYFNGNWESGIQGFCINRKNFGSSRIFVKKGELAEVMLTIGHELGHLQTAPLPSVEEEAKAFAFSADWMNKIREKDIAGLREVIVNQNPAHNGLHDVAYNFVVTCMRTGMKAEAVFEKLINGTTINSLDEI